jgi:Carboxypeptidase regulatory-like domain
MLPQTPQVKVLVAGIIDQSTAGLTLPLPPRFTGNTTGCRVCTWTVAVIASWLLVCCPSAFGGADPDRVSGKVIDPDGVAVAGAHIRVLNAVGTVVREATSDQSGSFDFGELKPGDYTLTAETSAFAPIGAAVSVVAGQHAEIKLQFREIASMRQAITVVGASAPSPLTPDPSEHVIVHDQVLDANPGRPGAPVSLPGLPIETASGGIKAPQYFSPGVAGDHGEPIAQFYQIGDFLYPNNLPANAHGNGYADPNFLIAPIIEAVAVDGGAFNVREGNHSIDLAATYVPRERLDDFVELTGDYRDIDLVAGWSPRNPATNAFVAIEASYGNGYLARLEHRQQYKVNASRQFKLGRHELTLFGVGYYGFSYVPGLIPINTFVPDDTVDRRQSDYTHTTIFIASDTWRINDRSQFTYSSFFRTYTLQLRSNFQPDFKQSLEFPGGLIQQSELRTVAGGGAVYSQKIRPWLSLLAGFDLRRDAPRDLDLKAANAEGVFEPVTSNNLTLSFVEPYIAIDGALSKYLHYDLGIRREEIWIDNQDLINAQNSFDKLAGLTLPKATLTILPPASTLLPAVAFSYGEAFHTEDPRIGTGTGEPTLLAPSRAYQLVLDKSIKKTEFKITLKHVTNSQELAKIDPDTGLQEDEGPSLNRVIVVSLQRTFSQGSIYASYGQADSRDLTTGAPTPEAPRFIWDTVVTEDHLPWKLHARGEFEYVRAKPVGDGFTGPAVPEFRGQVLRPIMDGRMTLSTEFLIAHGYTGETTEVFAFPSDPTYSAPIERVVGVPLKSYATVSWTYHFQRH